MGRVDYPAAYIGKSCLELKKVAAAAGLDFLSYLLSMTALEAVHEQMKDLPEDQSAERSRLIVNSICPSQVTDQASSQP